MFRKLREQWVNARNILRENRVLGFIDGKRYDKMAQTLKMPQYYHQIKINDFPLIFFLINQKDQQAISTLLDKIQYKAQVLKDQQNPMSMTPICYAFIDGQSQIVDVLEKNGADLKKPNKSNQNILHLAAIYKQQEAFKKAIGLNVDYNLQDQFGNTPFHYAARIGSPQLVKILVTAKAKKLENKIHQYPVHLAIQSSSLQTLEVLKSDVTGIYPKFHPIHSASRSGSIKMFEQILKIKPGSLNMKDYQGLTPLHHAVMLQDIQMTKQILSKPGILVNETDKFGNTPLHLSMMNSNLELSKMLVQKNANLDMLNQDSLSPADYGITSKNKEMHSLLLSWRDRSVKVEEWSINKY